MARADFDTKMQKALEIYKLAGLRPRLLLHVCCAPCSSAVLERLHEALDITLFYFSPNIDSPFEHEARAAELLRLNDQSGFASGCVITQYQPERYREAVRGLEKEQEGGRRCEACFSLRLREAARYAKANGFELFTTTLTISPLKNAALLNRLGESIGDAEGIAFLNSDFKKRGGYQRSTELSRQYELYRQDYCGCAFSKAEAIRRRQRQQKAQ